jgi:hypothetical protein
MARTAELVRRQETEVGSQKEERRMAHTSRSMYAPDLTRETSHMGSVADMKDNVGATRCLRSSDF